MRKQNVWRVAHGCEPFCFVVLSLGRFPGRFRKVFGGVFGGFSGGVHVVGLVGLVGLFGGISGISVGVDKV